MVRSDDDVRRQVEERVRAEVKSAHKEFRKQMQEGKLTEDGFQLALGNVEVRSRSFWSRVLGRP